MINNNTIVTTKKNTNLFEPNPFNIFKLLEYYSDINPNNAFIKMDNRPVLDIVDVFNTNDDGTPIYTYNEDDVMIRDKNICFTSDDKVDMKVYFIKGVHLAVPRHKLDINDGAFNAPVSYIKMNNSGSLSYRYGIILIFVDVIIEDFSRLYTIVKPDNMYEFIDNLTYKDVIEVRNMSRALRDMIFLIEDLYEASYHFDIEINPETHEKTTISIDDIIAAKFLLNFFSSYIETNPNFRDIIKSAIGSVSMYDYLERAFGEEYDDTSILEQNPEDLVPKQLIDAVYENIRPSDSCTFKDYEITTNLVTDLIFDVMDYDFFNKKYHDQIIVILKYVKSKNILRYFYEY